MRLILIRHGQTPNNVLGLLDTAVPGPGLTSLGGLQAEALVDALAGETIDDLYISNLTRTALTAAPLAAARTLTHTVKTGLREISAGTLEMKGDRASVEAYLLTLKSWLTGDLEVRMPGAETGRQVLERFDAVVAEAATLRGDGTVAMVSHGAMIRFWAGYRGINLDWSDAKYHDLSNTGIVILEGEPTPSSSPGGWEIRAWHGSPAGGLKGLEEDGPTAELTAEAIVNGHENG
ncbi:histidine phosphatase family protein [Arthrobacter sp. HLT1-20]